MSSARRDGMADRPHDAIVKYAFSQIEHATGLLKSALPAEIVSAVDWGALRIEKDSFIDPDLRSTFSDLVYSATMNGHEPLFFYMVLEHRSTGEALLVFRLSQYMGRLWERLLRDQPERKKLPPVVPILLHRGKTPWTAPTAFQDIVEGSGSARAALEPHIPRFELRVMDLTDGQASLLALEYLTALDRVVLWALTVAHESERLLAEIDGMIEAIVETYLAPNGHEALQAILRYLSATHERLSSKELYEIVMEAADRKNRKEVFVDLVDYLKHEGKVEGELEGIRKGERAILLRMLRARFGDVPDGVEQRVKAAGEKELEKWSLRVLTASTAEDVVA